MRGIATGGYDSKQGYAENNAITINIIYKNDTKDQEIGQIELNYDTHNNVITNNHIYASNSRIFISNNFNKTPETNLITIITMVISVKVMVCGNGKEKRIKDFQLIKQV